MDAILSAITSIFTAAIGWVGQVAATIVAEPILLVFNLLGLVGLGIGLFHRLKG